MIRFAYAGFLLWHPGFTEHTAYTILLVGITIDMAFEVLKSWAEDGFGTAFFLLCFVIPINIVMWHQTWFEEHTVLKWYFILASIAAALTLFLHAAVASSNSSRRPRAMSF
jgi:hypothetical protein